MGKFSFHSSETFWLAQKLSHHELACPSCIHNLGEFRLPFFLENLEMVEEIILWIILFLIQNIQNNFIQSIHWTCLNVQLNYGFWIYFLFLHVKMKTAQKISRIVRWIKTCVFQQLVVTHSELDKSLYLRDSQICERLLLLKVKPNL